jgi:hypothetical protein
VDEAAQHFLAGSGRAVDQDRDFARGEPLGQSQYRKRFRIGGDRKAGLVERRNQCCQRGFGHRITVAQCEMAALPFAAELVGGAAFEQNAGARAWRNCIALAAQGGGAEAGGRSQDRHRALHQRRVGPCHAIACCQSAHPICPFALTMLRGGLSALVTSKGSVI